MNDDIKSYDIQIDKLKKERESIIEFSEFLG